MTPVSVEIFLFTLLLISQKNDQEKDFLKIQKAHSTQQAVIQKLQDRLKKMKKLEETCKQQEDMIQKMENVIASHHRDRHKLGNKSKMTMSLSTNMS